MDENKLPVGEELMGVSCVRVEEFGGGDLSLDSVRLRFMSVTMILTPIVDSDEIAIQLSDVPTDGSSGDPPDMLRPLIGKKLQSAWICTNVNGYQDLVLLAIDGISPNVGFLSEGSSIKILRLGKETRQQQ